MRRVTKIFSGLLITLFLMALVAINGLLIWVATGPRTLDSISPYIEQSLSREGQFAVHIGQTWLVWDGWKHPVDIRLRNVSVTTADGQEFSSFPEISLGVHVLSLLEGKVLPSSLTLNKPVISLLQNDDHSISFGLNASGEEAPAAQTDRTVPFAAVLMSLLTPDENSNLRKLRHISIQHANVSVGSISEGVFFTSADTNMVFHRSRRGIVNATLTAGIMYDKYHTPLEATLALDKNGIEGNLTFSQLWPGILSELFSDNPHLKQISVPFDGNAKLTMDLDGNIKNLSFTLDGGKGAISSPYLESTLDVTAIHAEGQVSNDLHDIQIDTLTAGINGSDIAASGLVSLGKDNDAAIQVKASIANVAAGNVHIFWPPSLAPLTREWVIDNIKAGHVPRADVHVNIGMGDLAKPILPRETVDANIQLADAEITYLEGHPPVTKINGNIHVDGIALDATIDHAHYMDATQLSEGRVSIADLNPDNPYIEVSLAADTNATDMVRFLGLPRLEKAKKLNLTDGASGLVKGRAKVGFHFYAPQDELGKPGDPDIAYDIVANLAGMSQKQFMQKFDLTAIDGSLTINNQLLEFKGSGNVNGATVSESTVKYLFTPTASPDGPMDTFIDVKAATPVELLPRFGYPAFPFISGRIAVDANLIQGESIETARATINLTDASIERDDIRWKKPAGAAAQLELTSRKSAGLVTLPNFRLTAPDVDASGNASLSRDLSGIDFIWFSKLVYGQTNLKKLTYETLNNGYKVELSGNVLDISPWIEDDPENPAEPTFSFRHFPALDLKADVTKLITRKEHALTDVKAQVNCTAQRCASADITGALAGAKPFSFRIFRNPKGIRQLSVNADDAGELLAALNSLDGMEGGVLGIVGDYNDGNPDSSVLTGRMFIGSHTVRGVPILARLLSLASLTGIIDTLQGKGIQFDKLRMPFTLEGDVITIKDAKTYGSAMGLTADGTMTFPQRVMQIEGTIVPSYTLNNVFGRMPLIGSILTGGKNEGVFAARYSIKGTSGKPDISVNPLSFLTPGFLRGLFDILDAPTKTDTKTDTKKTETPDPQSDILEPIPVPVPEKNP